ncbi:MAG: 50S ribosomal protein L29 [Planctomycetes bacterium]|nr:50S ribosomal protein L29 [Planctomycetota bacterium]
MRSSELKTKTDAELEFDLRNARRRLFDLRLKQSVGGDQNPSAVGETRRTIARILTILQERKLGVRGEKPRS